MVCVGGKGRAGAVTVFLRIFCPLLGRDELLAGTRKVLVSANATLHIQRGPPGLQPAREALAEAKPWKPCHKHPARPGLRHSSKNETTAWFHVIPTRREKLCTIHPVWKRREGFSGKPLDCHLA